MTREDIMRMAQQSDLARVCGPLKTLLDPAMENLQRFAAIVAAAEREACIKTCKAQKQLLAEYEHKFGSLGIEMCVEAIKTRDINEKRRIYQTGA